MPTFFFLVFFFFFFFFSLLLFLSEPIHPFIQSLGFTRSFVLGEFWGFEMEKKQGFFSALKDEVVRGLSPARSRPKSPKTRSGSPNSGLLQRKKRVEHHAAQPEPFLSRSGSLRWGAMEGETLPPLMEGPDPDFGDDGAVGDPKRAGSGLGHWMKGQLFFRAPSHVSSSAPPAYKRSDLRLLLGVMGAPLAPVHVSSTDPLPHLCIKDTPIVRKSLSLSLSL